jgi:hypothetical protein
MLERSKLLIATSLLVFSNFSCAENSVHVDTLRFSGNLDKPEEVLSYVKSLPADRKEDAEKDYQALQDRLLRFHQGKGQSWGSVYKFSGESLLFFPTGKMFLIFIEANLRNWHENNLKKNGEQQNISQQTQWIITKNIGYFNSAIALENDTPSLSNEKKKSLIFYRDCLKSYQETGVEITGCSPLQWGGFHSLEKER